MICEHQFVSTSKEKTVTAQGLIGVIVFLLGICSAVVNLIAGLVVAIIGILIGMVGRQKSIILCAKCGEPAPHQP